MRASLHRVKDLLTGLLVVSALAWSGTSTAQPAPASASAVAEVEFARGVGFAQTPGQVPRTLGRGLVLAEGDRVTTAEGAQAILRFVDGTRMTVRPGSEMVVQTFRFRENADDNSFVLQMLRGGLRAVTGLINKTSPNAARIQTNTATIGIRGTDFDARLCRADCAQEASRINESPRPNSVLASAKIIQLQGEANAVDAQGQRRRLSDGGSVFPGETVEMSTSGGGVLIFRDETRITLGSSARIRVDNFVYDEANPREGRFAATFLRGTFRALTGLVARANSRNANFSTSTATIGIRGTGFDVVCTGACAGESGGQDGAPTTGGSASGLTVGVWLGAIEVVGPNGNVLGVLNVGQALLVTPAGAFPVPVPQINIIRPDGVTVPLQQLFGTSGGSEGQEGLFVFVRSGDVEVATPGGVLRLSRGETGFAGLDGATFRPVLTPLFITFDPVLMPNTSNPALMLMFRSQGLGQGRSVCAP